MTSRGSFIRSVLHFSKLHQCHLEWSQFSKWRADGRSQYLHTWNSWALSSLSKKLVSIKIVSKIAYEWAQKCIIFQFRQCFSVVLHKPTKNGKSTANVNKQLTCHFESCCFWVIYQEQKCLRPQRRWRSQCLLGIWNILSGRLHRLLQQWLDQSLRWKG